MMRNKTQEIKELGKMLTATTAKDKKRLKAIYTKLGSLIIKNKGN